MENTPEPNGGALKLIATTLNSTALDRLSRLLQFTINEFDQPSTHAAYYLIETENWNEGGNEAAELNAKPNAAEFQLSVIRLHFISAKLMNSQNSPCMFVFSDLISMCPI